MDLLEIRKKAKGQKEAEEKARAEGAPAPGEKTAAQEEAPAPRPKRASEPKQRAKARKKPVTSPPREEEPEEAATAFEEPAAASAQPAAEAAPGALEVERGLSWGFEDEEGDDAEGELVEYLAFRLSKEEYAVKVEDVKEIIRLQNITHVPRAPGFVEGIISLRGVIIPVFDIKKRLKLEGEERTRATRIIVLSEGGSPQGVIVDRVTGVVRLNSEGIEPPPAVIGGVEGEYIEGIGRIEDRMLIIFNTARVLEMEG